ncbi:O-antigen ligase family protein [Macrococcus lamae]|uniref:Oligosaccharide repeat unit polymerase n=1 Tax=Macrococcus lamae TaxID=198484 RepID=A0A4R6BS27_9STAP|nr:oligosaccharide repeat unit polymerase [Macrococcus lamae]TDM05190.1 oligosaccharide repeat unit polymerase [Macrococcus lamae]
MEKIQFENIKHCKNKQLLVKQQSLFIFTFILSICTIMPFYNLFFGNNIFYIMKYISFIMFALIILYLNRKIKIDLYSVLIILLIIFTGSLSIINVSFDNFSHTLIYIVIGVSIATSSEMVFKNISKEYHTIINYTILTAILIIVLLPSLYYSLFSSSYYISTEGRYRFLGVFKNSNELARFCFLSLLISLRYLSFNSIKLVRFLLIFNIILSFYIIFISNSRTSFYLSILAVLIYLSLFLIKVYKNTAVVFIISSLLLLLSLGAIKLYNASHQFNIKSFNDLLSGRLNAWIPILRQSFTDLLLGTGTQREGFAATIVIANGYIETLQYIGIIGLFAWGIFIIHMLTKKFFFAMLNKNLSDFFGIVIIAIFLLYYFFEGGLISIGNLASIYFWLELSRKH